MSRLTMGSLFDGIGGSVSYTHLDVYKRQVQQAVIATVNENYDDVYHSVREGYAAGWFPEGDGEWFESIDAGDIYGNLSYILGLTTDGDGYMKYAGNELEYTLSDLSVHCLLYTSCGDFQGVTGASA